MMTLIDRWFGRVSESQEYQSSDYFVLWCVLAAGVFFRFWGLGNVGLHGDEETMAMPAMAILEQGQPLLPSGMYYARAQLNLYLMSGSVWLFGESEWSFRLPSAIVGSLAGLAAFFMGRRFLSPQFNLAFVATMSFLPGLIEVSQTARMYVFLVTCLVWFGACIFRWERDQRISSLLLAAFVWVLSLHFHTLAIFAALLFLFPGLSRRCWTQLFQGAAAFVIGGVLFQLYSQWISSKYPGYHERPEPVVGEGGTQSATDALMSVSPALLIATFVAVAAMAGFFLVKANKRVGWSQLAPVLLVILALTAMALLHYHIGGILFMLGIVFWLRNPILPRSLLVGALLLAAVMCALHLGALYSTGIYPGRKLIGALIGTPSVWPVFRFLEFAPVAGAIYFAVLAFVLLRFAKGHAMPIHVLYFALAVWAPLLILGYFAWYLPPRYAIGQIGYFLMCTFAGIAFMARQLNSVSDDARLSRVNLVLLALLTLAIVNPLEFARTVNPDYTKYPDHKGAAEYIMSLGLDSDAVLIAEDILQQTYYLKEVDYYLREIDRAQHYAVVRDGRVVDQYTAAEVLGTGAELEKVLSRNSGRNVYVIGSGENFVDGRRLFRGRGIADVLASDQLEVVYNGRDGKTLVWKLAN